MPMTKVSAKYNLEEEKFILAHSFRVFSPRSYSIVLGLKRSRKSWQKCEVWESSLAHGSWEAERKEPATKYIPQAHSPRDLLRTRLHCQQFHLLSSRLFSYQCIKPLTSLEPSWSDHFPKSTSEHCCVGEQDVNTFIFGGYFYNIIRYDCCYLVNFCLLKLLAVSSQMNGGGCQDREDIVSNTFVIKQKYLDNSKYNFIVIDKIGCLSIYWRFVSICSRLIWLTYFFNR